MVNLRKLLMPVLLSASIHAMADDFVGVRNGLPYRLGSAKALRTADTTKQALDWSCASSSLADAVRAKFGIEVLEQPLFDLIVAPLAGNTDALAKIESRGMHVGHLCEMAKGLGLFGQGVTRSLGGLLDDEPLPVIARITERDADDSDKTIQHWVTVRGIAGNRILVRDPTRGNRRMPIHEFAAVWLGHDAKGLLFRIEDDSKRLGYSRPNASQPGSGTVTDSYRIAENGCVVPIASLEQRP